MLSWVIQIFLISIIFIFLVHHLLMFFKTTLTVPRIKDLVNTPNQKYQHIYDIISHNKNSFEYTDIDLLPSDNNLNNNSTIMKNELKSFLKKQLNVNNDSGVIGIDTGAGNFTNF